MSDLTSIRRHGASSYQDSTQDQLDSIRVGLADQSRTLEELVKRSERHSKIQDEILELHRHVRGFLTVAGWLERAGLWLAKMAAAGGLIWLAFKFAIKEGLER